MRDQWEGISLSGGMGQCVQAGGSEGRDVDRSEIQIEQVEPSRRDAGGGQGTDDRQMTRFSN